MRFEEINGPSATVEYEVLEGHVILDSQWHRTPDKSESDGWRKSDLTGEDEYSIMVGDETDFPADVLGNQPISFLKRPRLAPITEEEAAAYSR